MQRFEKVNLNWVRGQLHEAGQEVEKDSYHCDGAFKR